MLANQLASIGSGPEFDSWCLQICFASSRVMDVEFCLFVGESVWLMVRMRLFWIFAWMVLVR